MKFYCWNLRANRNIPKIGMPIWYFKAWENIRPFSGYIFTSQGFQVKCKHVASSLTGLIKAWLLYTYSWLQYHCTEKHQTCFTIVALRVFYLRFWGRNNGFWVLVHKIKKTGNSFLISKHPKILKIRQPTPILGPRK